MTQTSETIIEHLLKQKKISVREAMVLLKDCVHDNFSIPDYYKFGDYPLITAPTMNDRTNGLLNQITYNSNSSGVSTNQFSTNGTTITNIVK